MKSKRVARFALLTALALILSYLESLVPVSGAVPGMKLGLTNLAVVFALYRLGVREAGLLSLLRAVLASALFGTAYSLAYSLTGAALSFLVMAALKRSEKFSLLGVSVAGGVCHNVAQVLVAMALLGTGKLLWYLPLLLFSGVIAGAAIGALGAVIAKRIPLD